MRPRIIEPVIQTFGAFRVRQLIMQIEGQEPRPLEVSRLTLTEIPREARISGQEIPLKTIHNSRLDLSWIVYSVEEYLDDLAFGMKSLDEELKEHSSPEQLAEGIGRMPAIPDARWAQLIARQYLTPHPRQRELMEIFHRRATEALQQLRASHPEGIADKLQEIRGQYPDLDLALGGDTQEQVSMWRQELQRPRSFDRILGERVLESGPFQVFEDFGYYARNDIHLNPLQQRMDGSWASVTYMIYFQRDLPADDLPVSGVAPENEARNEIFPKSEYGKSAIGLFSSWQKPGAEQLCGPVGHWLAERREMQERTRAWMLESQRVAQEGMQEEEESQTHAELVALGALQIAEEMARQAAAKEAQKTPEEPAADDALGQDEEYRAVYDAWVALGCADKQAKKV